MPLPYEEALSASAFAPARWARGPHVQTLVARSLRSPRDPYVRRVRLDTPDGDFLDVDLGADPGPTAPITMVLHGLEGSSRRRYVLSACRLLHDRGVFAVAVSLRGCSGELNRLPRMYHSGETGDPAFVLQWIRSRYPGRPVGAFGFSLGGNALLKLMGERDDGGAGLLDAAVAMSVPFDLAAGGDLLERHGAGRLYVRYFLRSLRKKVQGKRDLLNGHADVEGALRARTLRAFDEAATAPLHGFRSADHYYAESSSAGYVAGVRVPTLVVHSRDDPFLPEEAIPEQAMRANPHLVTAFTECGGHVGFLHGSPWRPRFWAEEQGARFLAGRLGNG